MNTTPKYDAQEIQHIRAIFNLTQSAFAEALGCSTKMVEEWESGVSSPDDFANKLIHMLQKRPEAFGIAVNLNETSIRDIPEFKRNLYYDTEETLRDGCAVFLLGSRKCGKSICMQQIRMSHENAEYYDIKQMTDAETDALLDAISESISKNEDKIYLIDEATYFENPEVSLAKISYSLNDSPNTKTKFVFSGSQSVSLETWANLYFGGYMKMIHSDFISYPEWLAWKGISEVSADTYHQFLLGTKEFYPRFETVEEYLNGCIEETLHSNQKARNVIRDNSMEFVSTESLVSILHAALIAESNRPSADSFFDTTQMFRDLRANFKAIVKEIGTEEVQKRTEEFFAERVGRYTFLPFEELRQNLIFLHRSNLLTITTVSDETENFRNVLNIHKDLRSMSPILDNCMKIFRTANISVKHPFFYAEIVKEVLKEAMPLNISGMLLGGMVECHVRGLLPEDSCYEYHNNGREVDYVNFAQKKALECTISNKHGSQLRFDDLLDGFTCTLLTKDQDFTEKNGLVRIPYYQFIFQKSDGERTFALNNMTPQYTTGKEKKRSEEISPDKKSKQVGFEDV